MKRLAYFSSIAAATTWFAGCGWSQQPVGAPGAMPQSVAASAPADTGSWMLPEAKSEDLLYVSSCCWVSVYTYPQGKAVGELSDFESPQGQCVDSAGNVYITDDGRSRVYKYAHGTSKPKRAFFVPGALDCSIDPTTENLAVASWAGEGVWIFKSTGGRPTKYKNSDFLGYYACGYDSKGNLFIDGVSRLGSGNVVFAELPKGGSKLRTVKVGQYLAFPAGVKWDGKHWAVGDGSIPAIYQVVVRGRSGTIVGTTYLDSGEWATHQFWIQGEKLLTATQCYHRCYGTRSNVAVMFFNYPTGGTATKAVTSGFKGAPDGDSVSLASR